MLHSDNYMVNSMEMELRLTLNRVYPDWQTPAHEVAIGSPNDIKRISSRQRMMSVTASHLAPRYNTSGQGP